MAEIASLDSNISQQMLHSNGGTTLTWKTWTSTEINASKEKNDGVTEKNAFLKFF